MGEKINHSYVISNILLTYPTNYLENFVIELVEFNVED